MCLSPFRATRDYTIEDAGPFKRKEKFGKIRLSNEGELLLPCGKCSECISKRAFDWATRTRHEISCHDQNTFITLTYDEENLKKINPLHFKREFQLFMKKLRKERPNPLRYLVSHEYGGKTGRPHHHAIIFGYDPQDQYHFTNSPSGEKLYRSNELEKLWTNGISSIGTANEKTAYYIASYALKSNTINSVHPTTHEIIELKDSMDTSKRPAIGKNYLMQNYQQLFGQNTMLPRYYIKLIEKQLEPDLPQEKRFISINTADELLNKYETHQQSNIRIKTPQQKYAKHIITTQKQDSKEKALRDDINQTRLQHTTDQLKFNRNQAETHFKNLKEIK